MRVVLTVEASAELREATAWYTARSREVGRRFVAAYKRSRGLIAEAPARWRSCINVNIPIAGAIVRMFVAKPTQVDNSAELKSK